MRNRGWFVVLLALVGAPAFGGDAKITFCKDVALIFYSKCVSCHRPGEIGPFSLTDYASARPWAKSIRKAVFERVMPPWHADSSKTAFLNDRSLTQAEIGTIVQWVNQGAQEGNKSECPPLPTFDATWGMGQPDFIFHAERDFTIPAGTDNIPYQSIHFKTELSEDLYVTQWEIRPTYRGAVHHANLVRAPVRLDHVGVGQAVMAGGDYIGSYLPGARPMKYPEGTSIFIPKGSIISIQVHYVPGEKEITDHLMFGVKYAQGRIDKLVRTIGTDDKAIEIQPFQSDWTMDTEVELLYDVTVLSSGAHMHLRGRAYDSTAILPDGSEKLIASVPRYDFNWQSNYQLANPLQIPKGSRYHVKAHWDNSDNNPNNPDPSQKVVYGPWTENEMLTTWSHVVRTDEKLGLKLKDGHVVGKFDDAQPFDFPPVLQTLPKTMQPKQQQAAASSD